MSFRLHRVLLASLVLGSMAMGRAPYAVAEDGTDLQAAINQCKRVSDKQAVISSCSAVIAGSRDPHMLERAYNRRGMANEATGQFNAAVNDYSEVIRLDPRIAGYYDNRMRAYKALGQLDLALQDSNTAVRMAPTYPFVFHGRGAVRFDRGEYALAVQDYSSALSLNAADAPLLVDRGRAWMKLGDTDKAVTDFTNAHAVDPNFMPALRERGMAEARLGDRDGARSDLSAALASGGNDDEAAAALAGLDGSPVPPGAATRFAQNESPPNAAASSGGATATQQAEQDAERQLQAVKDAEQARQEAATRLKAERLVAATTAARTALGEAADFVKANRDDPQLLDHLQRIADLNAALPNAEPGPIERKTAALTAGLTADPAYGAYKEQHATERQREAARDLSDALRTLKVQKGFLIGAVVQDPTGASASAFLSLAKQVDANLANPDLARAQTLVGTIDTTVTKAGLGNSYKAAQRAAAEAAGSKLPASEPSP